MVIYTLSSTDPEHFNRIQAKLPTELSSRFVNLCVTSLTSNCNIEVMNNSDYIVFKFKPDDRSMNAPKGDGEPFTICCDMERYSKLTTASLPYILQDLLNTYEIPITASISNLDTLIFTSEIPFEITEMSYNMKLITGFYSYKDFNYPIQAIEDQEEYSVIDHKNKPLTDFSALDLNIRTHDVRPIEYLITPPDAYGFNVQLRSENEHIARVEQNLIMGISAGEANIVVEVRNPDTLLTSAPDFTDNITVRVTDGIRTRIESVELPDSITLYQSESTTLYPEITPINAAYYIESWESDKPEFASVVSGYIQGLQPGTAIITYRITNNLEEETQTIEKQVFVNVKSPIAYRKVYRTEAPAVGYMLSTPILYLLTSVGSPVFYNEMQTQDKMQCGTISMVLNNSYSSSFPIVAQQNSIVTRTPLNFTSCITFTLVDANMRDVKLLNPMYITVSVDPEMENSTVQQLQTA